uniref:serine/arginine repetitive matrix protein 1-like n=1 Tax=Panthera onca TaxID=9690 RepID=UPI002952C5B2|nr:serine/arginine repetitive matrix protein 1-like [Panthera onca]
MAVSRVLAPGAGYSVCGGFDSRPALQCWARILRPRELPALLVPGGGGVGRGRAAGAEEAAVPNRWGSPRESEQRGRQRPPPPREPDAARLQGAREGRGLPPHPARSNAVDLFPGRLREARSVRVHRESRLGSRAAASARPPAHPPAGRSRRGRRGKPSARDFSAAATLPGPAGRRSAHAHHTHVGTPPAARRPQPSLRPRQRQRGGGAPGCPHLHPRVGDGGAEARLPAYASVSFTSPSVSRRRPRSFSPSPPAVAAAASPPPLLRLPSRPETRRTARPLSGATFGLRGRYPLPAGRGDLPGVAVGEGRAARPLCSGDRRRGPPPAAAAGSVTRTQPARSPPPPGDHPDQVAARAF